MFCKYCGHPLDADHICAQCGKENILVNRSTDLDVLMKGDRTGKQETSESLASAKRDGYREGYERGVKAGYKSGYSAGKRDLPRFLRHYRITAAVLLAVLALGITISSLISNHSGYKSGWSAAMAVTPTPTVSPTPSPTPSPSPSPSPTPFVLEAPTEVIKKGSRGVQVERIQARLQNMGYEIEVDGFYGSRTATAVRQFQKAMGFDETGEVDLQTCCALLQERKDEPSSENPSAAIASVSPSPSDTPVPQSTEDPDAEATSKATNQIMPASEGGDDDQ